MRVLSLNFGDANCASSFYRVLQYVEPLRRLGIGLEPVPASVFDAWNSLGDYDLVIVQKKLLSLSKVRWLRHRTRRLIYEVDDAVWEAHGRPHHWLTRWRTWLRVRGIARAARSCLAPNKVLATQLRRWNSHVEVIPMALDESNWPAKKKPVGEDKPVRIGWAGAPVNLVYLEAIEPALLAVQERNPRVEFAVFSGRKPNFQELRFEYLPFKPGTESEAIRSFEIGLLPLPDGKFSEAKSPIKGLQYMASGIVSVASPLGGTREMFGDRQTAVFARTEPEWVEALEQLIRAPERRTDMGQQARLRFEEAHSLGNLAPLLARLLRSS